MRAASVFLASLAFAASQPAAAQNARPAHSIVGRVTSIADGSPVADARVTALGARDGRFPTDADGRFRIDGLRSREFELEVHCPSRTLLGKHLLTRRVRLRGVDPDTVDAQVDASLCDEPAPTVRRGVFSGLFTSGFEESSFRPCRDSRFATIPPDANDAALANLRAWVTFSSAVQPGRSFQWPATVVEVNDSPAFWVRLAGTLSGPGTYGHLGASDYRIVVDSVLAIEGWGAANCGTRPH